MFHFVSLVLFFGLSLMKEVSAETCYAGFSSYYTCSPGQTCGNEFYGDCRGLSTYAIMGIVFGCITTLSICIRCCVRLSANNTQSRPPSAQHRGPIQVQIHSVTNNMAHRSRTAVPVHNVIEDAPPTYAAATTSTAGHGKY